MSACPVAGVDIVELYEWIDGEYVFGVTIAAPAAEDKRLNNYQMERLLEWLSIRYGRNDWYLESIEEPA